MSCKVEKHKNKCLYLLELRKYRRSASNITKCIIGIFNSLKDVESYVQQYGRSWVTKKRYFFAISEMFEASDHLDDIPHQAFCMVKCINVNGEQIDQFSKFWKTKKSQ